jgi:hypothetical protein
MEKRRLLISRCMKYKSDGSEDMRQQEVFGLFLLEESEGERHGSLTWQIVAVGFSGVEIVIGGSKRCVKSGLRAKSGVDMVCFNFK